ERDGVLHRPGDLETAYRRRWEDEAVEDHVRSAIARSGDGDGDVGLATLISKVTPLVQRFPQGLHVGAALEIGSGYGRIPLFLARERGLTWDTYCAVDISATMLQRLREYHDRFEIVPAGALYAIC